MSLLLDALKKAAKEKQQADSADSSAEQNSVSNKDEIELSLDESVAAEQKSPQPESSQTEGLSIEPVPERKKTSATTSTVSDEALQLLVYKTNKQFRRKQKMIWGGAMASALFILILGGAYYYYVMLEEVESLERKHEIAMRLFKSKAIDNKKIPAMTSPVQHKQQAAVNKKPSKAAVVVPRTKRATGSNSSAGVFSIQRTEKRDPVSLLLNRGWHAYGNADYVVAADAYNQVLEREPRNRDALLGVAAIAVKQGDYPLARAAYKTLLRLDPRDQIAVAAMSNLDELAPDLLGETRLKFMVQQQPEAAHLHFALGNYYAKQSRWPEAQGEYFSAWQGSSENADYAFNLAVSLDQLGKQDEAKRFYEKSLNLAAGKNISFSIEAVKDRLSKMAARQEK